MEQMAKNIVSMAHSIEHSLFGDNCSIDCRDCSANCGCSAYRAANHLAARGFGDLEQQTKNAVQEVLQRLFDIVREQAKHPMSTPVDWVGAAEYLAKEYGVEVH